MYAQIIVKRIECKEVSDDIIFTISVDKDLMFVQKYSNYHGKEYTAPI